MGVNVGFFNWSFILIYCIFWNDLLYPRAPYVCFCSSSDQQFSCLTSSFPYKSGLGNWIGSFYCLVGSFNDYFVTGTWTHCRYRPKAWKTRHSGLKNLFRRVSNLCLYPQAFLIKAVLHGSLLLLATMLIHRIHLWRPEGFRFNLMHQSWIYACNKGRTLALLPNRVLGTRPWGAMAR